MLAKANQRIVGILVGPSQVDPPFSSQPFFAHLCELGASWGMLVIVFSPIHLNLTTQTVQGYCYHAPHWIKGCFPLPDLIYDRAFFNSYTHYQQHRLAARSLQQLKRIPYLGIALKGKWSVHNALLQHPVLARHIPNTEYYRKPAQLLHWLKQHHSVVLKPEAGSQGKGVLVLTKTSAGHFQLHGRSNRNKPISHTFTAELPLLKWLNAYIGNRNYLIQQYLSLHTDQGRSYDIRVLMQKGNNGDWTLTGMAARIGQANSVTSNLHGGGKGAQVLPLLLKQFDLVQADRIIDTIKQISFLIPPHLEQHFGRLAELGLDLGIDHSGTVWVIEANSKPGRASARWFANPASIYQAMSNPMQYARYLLLKSANLGIILGG